MIAVCGVARSFLQSSRSALVAEIVPRALFTNAATWRSSTWQLGSVIGPAMGGLVYAAYGARVAFALVVALNVVAFGAMAGVRHMPTTVSVGADSIRRNLAAGLRFVASQPIILSAITLDMLAVFFGGAVALMPVFASDILHVGARGVGILQAAPGIGAVGMAIFVAHRPPFARAGRTLLTAVADLRRGDDRLRALPVVPALGGAPDRWWRGRQRERGDPRDAHPGPRPTRRCSGASPR